MVDIVPELLDAIKKDFAKSIQNNPAINRVYDLIKSGAATYKDANDYAVWVGRLLSVAINNHVTAATLPDGRMYYNIAERILGDTLNNNYELISKVADEIQTGLNVQAGIGIKAIKPPNNQDRISGLVDRISQETDFEKVAWLLDEPVVTFSQSVVDDFIKANAEFHARAGLSPTIVRTVVGKACEWCREVAGTYKYPDVPDDVYRRHERCRCTVEYNPGDGKKQGVWSKKWT